MKLNDAVSGVLVALFAIAIWICSAALPSMGQDIGPHVFPQALAGGFMICAVLLVLRGLRSHRTAGEGADAAGTTTNSGYWISLPEWARERHSLFAFLLIPLLLVFYIAVSEPLGFLPTAVVMLLALFLTFRVRLKLALPVALVSALGIHYIFYKLLKVPLAWGILQSIAW